VIVKGISEVDFEMLRIFATPSTILSLSGSVGLSLYVVVLYWYTLYEEQCVAFLAKVK
jgi:hypothetical protein